MTIRKGAAKAAMEKVVTTDGTIFKATYSGVPVYEFIAKGIACMRRRSDSWLNATQILKVAEFDKPQRTRILEREVQRGLHEKIQGGYGKYQGTWVPLDRGREIARLYNVEEILRPIFDFRPSTESPPLAPKHVTAASSKPRPSRATTRAPPPPKKVIKPIPPAPPSVESIEEEEDDVISDIEPLSSPAPSSLSPTQIGFSEAEEFNEETLPYHKQPGGTLKRKRTHIIDEENHFLPLEQRRRQAYSDELLDYFMSSGGGGLPAFLTHPPPDFNVNEIIDDEAHTAFHWAAAMGDLQVLELLLEAGADVTQVNARGETPLMRSVLFTNNYDRKSFPRLVELLRSTIPQTDKFRSTVFHHIAATTLSRNKCIAARYYADVLLQKMTEIYTMKDIVYTLDLQDQDGDTALTIAARNGAKKLIRSLLAYNADPHIPNMQGQTADELIVEVEKRKAYSQQPQGVLSSSSPFQPHQSLPRDINPNARYNHPRQNSIGGGHPYHPGAVSNSTALEILPHHHLPPQHSQPHPNNHHHPTYLPQPHISEAAIRATQKVIPDLNEKLEALATAFDTELEEKEKDLKQAKTLLEDTERDVAVITDMYLDLDRMYTGGTDELLREIERMNKEEVELKEELRMAVERRQVFELEEEVRKAESQIPQANGGVESTPDLLTKLSLAQDLHKLQSERLNSVTGIVGLYARSGSGEGDKIGIYRRLIANSVGLELDQVEDILPELLKTLERGDGGSVGVGPAGAGVGVEGRRLLLEGMVGASAERVRA